MRLLRGLHLSWALANGHAIIASMLDAHPNVVEAHKCEYAICNEQAEQFNKKNYGLILSTTALTTASRLG